MEHRKQSPLTEQTFVVRAKEPKLSQAHRHRNAEDVEVLVSKLSDKAPSLFNNLAVTVMDQDKSLEILACKYDDFLSI